MEFFNIEEFHYDLIFLGTFIQRENFLIFSKLSKL